MKVKNIGGVAPTKDETLDVHLYKNKEDDHKKMGLWMFTNSDAYIIPRLSKMCCLFSYKGTWRKTQVETS
jgi:hypothetical protein